MIRHIVGRPAILLLLWSWKKQKLPKIGLAIVGYIWGFKRGEQRYKARKKLEKIALVKDIDEATLRELVGELPAWVKFPDYDRVVWLNNMAQNWWPCLSTAICRTVKYRLQRLLQAKKPDLFTSIVFETFSMGSVPPRCSGAKVYKTSEEEIILDLEMTWTATNADIVLSVRLAQGTVALPVQLSQVLFQGTVRLIFKPLVPYWPCFGAISVAFVGKPQVDFSLRLIGGELMSVPGLAPALHDLLKNRLLAVMVWPRRVYAPILKHLRKKKTDYENLQPKASGLMRTHLIQAKSLRTRGLSAIFVTFELGGLFKRSKVMGSASSLDFDEEEIFNFIVQHPDFEALRVTFYEIESQNPLDAQLLSYEELTAKFREKVEKDEFEVDPDVSVRKIGEGIMPILSVPSRKTVDIWLELGEGNGQVHIDVQYVSFSEELGAEVELEFTTPMPTMREVKVEELLGNGELAEAPANENGHLDMDHDKNSSSSSLNSLANEQQKKTKKRKRGRKKNVSIEEPKGKKGEAKDTRPSAQIGVLYLRLQEARGLVTSDWSGLCSAVVRLVVGDDTYESHIASKSLVPTWKQNFEIIIGDTRDPKVLTLEVWDHVSDFIGLFGNSTEFIGKREIPIKDLISGPSSAREWAVYSQGEDGEDMLTGQISMSAQWIGAPLSPFYVTPRSKEVDDEVDDAEKEISPLTTEYVKKTGKRIVLKVIRAFILLTLMLLLFLTLAPGAGSWFIKRLNFPRLNLSRVAEVWTWFIITWDIKSWKYPILPSMSHPLLLLDKIWLQWFGAEAMLAVAVLITVKLILWADQNGIVSALMQPPTRWFDLDRVQSEWNERQEVLNPSKPKAKKVN